MFASNKISMKDIDAYLSQNQMNFNFNDHLFPGIDDEIEKELRGLGGRGASPENGANETRSPGSPNECHSQERISMAEMQKELGKMNIDLDGLSLNDRNKAETETLQWLKE